MLSPQKIIGLFPDWFAPPAPDWPPQAQLTGFISFDDAREDSVSAAVEDFLKTGEPPLIFTPGTAMHHAAGFFSASLEACRLLGRRALLLTGNRSQLPSSLPAGVMHCPYLPFSKILPRGAALVHHGGIGTTAQALAAGIPQLVMPMAYDQPDNAARTERLGVGASISPARYRGPAVAKKLSYLLASLEVKARCGIYAAKIEYARAIEDACVAIEGVVAR
jgi:UDP:flavonoid glycosyltransferase YjiC (YdhE family)